MTLDVRDDALVIDDSGFFTDYQITGKSELSSGKRRWIISLEVESGRIA